MKKLILSIGLIISIGYSNPAVMGGFTYKFGASDLSGAGATLKILSTDEEKKPVVGAGISFYPWAKDSKKIGIDISAGYNFKSGAVMGGWDFLQNQASVSLGYNKSINSSDNNQFVDGIVDARCAASKNKDK